MGVLEKEDERQNVLDILRKTRIALKTEDVMTLREASSRTVHSASIYKDMDSIAVAVIVYALSKIIERKKYVAYEGWSVFYRKVLVGIDKGIDDLEGKNFIQFRKDIMEIRTGIGSLSGNLKTYIQDVFREAQISRASRLYEHGISSAETTQLLGITQFELAEYIGKTGIADVDLSMTMSMKTRLNFARSLFS
ncbi:MAG: hypothetical protein WC475_03655 [Candidatus Paceibacterota bacterium]